MAIRCLVGGGGGGGGGRGGKERKLVIQINKW